MFEGFRTVSTVLTEKLPHAVQNYTNVPESTVNRGKKSFLDVT